MDHLLLMMLGVLNFQMTSIQGFVNCRTACKKCSYGLEAWDLLEVYCSMCKECRDSRREKTGIYQELETTTPVHKMYMPVRLARQIELTADEKLSPPLEPLEDHSLRGGVVEAWPEGCPTPPACESEEQHEILVHPVKTTTTTPSTTTEPVTCPSVRTCKPKTTTQNVCVTPCMPMCAMPCMQNPGNIKVDINWKDMLRDDDRKVTTTETWLVNTEVQKLNNPVTPNILGSTNSAFVHAWNIPVSFNGRLNLEGQNSAIRTLNGALHNNEKNQRSNVAFDYNNYWSPNLNSKYQNNNIDNNGQLNFNIWSQTTGSVSDYFYVYLGVPKTAFNAVDAQGAAPNDNTK